MEYTYPKLFKQYARFIKPYRKQFILGSIIRAVGDLSWLYYAYAFAEIVTFVSKYHRGDSITPLYHVFIIWGIVVIVRQVCIFIGKFLCLGVGQNATLDIEAAALKHLSLLDISWHEKENAGSKIKKIQRGAEGMSSLVAVWVINIIEITINLVGMLFIISRFDKTLAGLVALYLIIFYIIASLFRKRTMSAITSVNIKEEEASGLLFEVINNIRSVKVLGMADALMERFQEMLTDLSEKKRIRRLLFHGGISVRNTWAGLASIGLAAIVIYGIFEGKYEVGFLVLFLAYFNSLTSSINELSGVAQDVGIAKLSMGRLAQILEEPVVIENEQGKTLFPKDWQIIHVQNLSFMYGDNKVLSNVSFDIKRGEKVGIIGLSGAGKSTLFKLLLKEHEDYTGDILIDDVPLKTITRNSYLRHAAAVLQETEVFNMTLRNNITLANIEAAGDTGLLQRALEISHVKDFLSKLASGADTLIGEKGVKLSGGEKQRLGIARAVFKNPDILFLDEATSHLDMESEKKIQDSLHHFFEDVTAVVIAHRLSTIREMNKIIVIEDGKIVESGTFDELYKKDGRFREFWDKQKI